MKDLIPYSPTARRSGAFAHHRRLRERLGAPIGRFRTASPHAVVVPHRAACSNPGCRYVHRMAALVAGGQRLHAEGELFLIGGETADVIDELETGCGGLAAPYARGVVTMLSVDGR
jgi:hypothetical protein